MKIKKELLSMLVGFLLIWAFPLIYYRSSLSVSYVFHQNRTLKYSSFGDYIIRMINIFSNTETRSSEPPDFSMLGPISNFLNHYLKLAFLASMLIIVLHSLLIVIPNLKLKTLFKKISSLFLKTGQLKITVDLYPYLLRSTILFFLILFIFGITISQPFAIWLIPILSIFPYKNYKQQTAILTLSTVYIMQMTSPIYSHIIPFANEQIFIYPVNWGIIKDTLRFLSLILLIILSLNLSYEKNPQN